LAPRDLSGQNYRPDLRPHVVNNSWGAAGGGTLYQAAVQAWLDSGIFPVFAFGNDGPGCGTGLVPASYLEAYAVGAFDFYDTITNFSSRGPSVFHPIKPDVAAPGDFIRSCVPPDSYATGLWGTSYSAPHVTGTVALMWSRSPELTGKVERTWLYLDRSAIDVEDLSCGGEPGNNNVWGEGRLDAFAAVSFVFIDGFESGDTSAWSISLP